MEEDDLDAVISSFLSKTAAPLMETETLTLILDHAPSLTEKQIKELFTAQKKVMELTGKTREQFDDILLGKVISMAVEKTYKETGMNFVAFQQILAQYYPAAATLETEKVKARYYKKLENNAECLKAVTQLLTNKTLKLKAYDLALTAITYSEIIVAEKQGDTFLRHINNYQLLPAEKNMAYYKNLALMSLYFYMDDKAHTKEYAQKVIDDKNAPDDIKEIAEKAIQ